ncbi:hypothetical protein [Streptomyces sp. UNOC14_S4]|uniref:hypothetical protein n=1 Tax=Streptomyces sp. UNOC14_S4 TaxID=2872340 RepID=UPI001E3591D5|nr:hypothetical protein [Streptomyces sp. UNOC14_S4]MCC3772167.1 hypothetical protein [Streptomyces sp. UNOC14_S4]
MIEDLLRGSQIRTPAYTSEQRAEDDRFLRARIEDAERRRACAARRAAGWLVPTSPELAALLLESVTGRSPGCMWQLKRRLHGDLKGLCCQVSRAPGAAARLIEFAEAERPTDPVAARGLGCLLYLAGHDDGARFWWRYAAGADDSTAAYCLFLEGLLRDEPVEAVHCYRELHGSDFLCDEDWETPLFSARTAATTKSPWAPDIGDRICEVTTGPGNRPVPIPEGYLQDASQAEREELLCHH